LVGGYGYWRTRTHDVDHPVQHSAKRSRTENVWFLRIGSTNGRSSTRRTSKPYAIALKDQALFAFAGLWESWKDKATGERLLTYTIVTTDPNELMEPLHNRMPVILRPQDYERWLEPVDPAHLPVDLLRRSPAD
jgi:putative SOS response-associated peptidase YedK